MTSRLEQSGAERAGAQALRPRSARVHAIGGVAPRQSQRPVALIIAGMHRSGTSALTRALSLCGLDLPRTLMTGNDFNQDGYWESDTIKRVNDDLLGALDSAWDDPLASRVVREGSYSRESLERIQAAVRDQFSEGRDIIIKDPRISLLFGAWREALDDLGYDPVLIIPVRHPLEVAASLSRRDRFPVLKSALLWLGHLLALERDSRGVARAFITYEDLLTDWRRCFKHIEGVTGFRLRRWTPAAEQEIDNFLTPERRHHSYDVAMLEARDDIPSWVVEAYRWTLEAARAETEPPAAALEAIAAQFHAAAEIFAPLLSFERRRAAQSTQSAPSEPPRAEPSAGPAHFCLYSASASADYNEATCVHHATRLASIPETITLTTPPRDEPLRTLRLDLADAPGRLLLHGLRVLNLDGEPIWEWTGDPGLFERDKGVAAESLGERLALLEFLNDDPQTELPAGDKLGGLRQAKVEFTVSAADPSALALVRLQQGHAGELRQLADKIAAAEQHGQSHAAASAEMLARLAATEEHDRQHAAAVAEMLTQLGELRLELEAVEAGHEPAPALSRRLDSLQDAAVQQLSATEALRADLAALGDRLARLEAESGETRVRLTEQMAHIEGGRRETLEQLVQQAARLQGERDAILARLGELRSLIDEQAARLNDQSARIAARDEALDRMAEQLAELNRATAAAAADAEAAADARTAQQSAFLERQLAVFQHDVAAQVRAAAEAHEAQLAVMQASLARVEADHAAASRLAQHATQMEHERNRAATDRDHAQAMAEHHLRDIATMRNSTSWRITAPMRALKDGPREALRSLRQTARKAKAALRKRLLGKSYADAAEAVRNSNDAQVLARSSLFDPKWYLATYPDVAMVGVNPLEHYLYHGAFEGRAPGPGFDSRWYLAQNPDVVAAGLNPLVHYLVAGRRENRAPLPPARHAPARLGDHVRLLGGGARHWKHLIARALLTFDPLLPRSAARRLQAARWANAPRAEDNTIVADTSIHAETLGQLYAAASARGAEYVPLAPTPIAATPRVRAIAFYLPQFHPIPENDAWWGKGFTEWTNVSKAAPQYVGHYQPRLPDELGFYDLRVPDVQRRQVELAKHYGVHGFCFHYYWFTGRKRLLERPLNQFLAATDIDFPFCICWANENWTRRWDGMDQDILMEQRHEPQDDLEFIEDLAPVLRDPRYIRIDGRPLIIVYRVDILPNPQRTAQVWRDYCRANGLGEPYLVAAQTFGIRDPRPYGFDAAVEFPPHNDYGEEEITHEQKFLNPKAEGRVYSYPKVARRYSSVSFPDYKLFKGIIPGWDNEARKPGRAHSFARSTPALYRSWLTALCRATDAQHQNPDEKLVFINAWNEWAEGAYLEPDRRFGYAYLEATREALSTVSDVPAGREAASGAPPAPTASEPPLAVIVHAYYHDVFGEVLSYLGRLNRPFSLYVTCPPERTQAVRSTFEESGLDCPFELIEVENRGRDVLAFFEVLRRAPISGDTVILKAHTKRSMHREDGAAWRRELYDRLLAPDIINKSLRAFAADPSLGLVAPERNLAPITTYLGFNQARIEGLLRQGGWSGIRQDSDVFAAGTMFFVRRSSLDPLLALGFERDDFEPEAGQVDGTLAHALERMFALVILREGGRITDTGAFEAGRWSANTDFDFAVKTDYLYRPDGAP